LCLATLTAAAGPVEAQLRRYLYTEPGLPPAEALDRLNLKMAWRTYLPMDGRRDGVFSMSIGEKQILVQLRSGMVVALDAATGTVQWRVQVGGGYVPPAGFGANEQSVFVTKGVRLFALERASGRLQWEFFLPSVASAAPVADEERFYVPIGTGRLMAYELPRFETASAPNGDKRPEGVPSTADTAKSGAKIPARSVLGSTGQSTQSVSAVSSQGQYVRAVGPLSSAIEARAQGYGGGPQPQLIWSYVAESRLELAPVLTNEYLLLAGYSGTFYAMAKLNGRQLYRFQAGPPLTAPIGQFGDIAYVASEDYTVYAHHMILGRVLWRFLGGGPITQKPRVTDDSVYVSPSRAGLYRLDRETGQVVWRNANAERFLATNKKFVYAKDYNGRLLVLDKARGTQLANYDGARDFVVPLANELNDRLYLASNDGLLVCLHDRDYRTPVKVKNVVKAVGLGAGEAKPAAPPEKGEMKKPEQDKEEGR
jgi:outer membrane protein assembly factor BamB